MRLSPLLALLAGALLLPWCSGCFQLPEQLCWTEPAHCSGDRTVVFECSGRVEQCAANEVCSESSPGFASCTLVCGDGLITGAETCEAGVGLFGPFGVPEGCNPDSCQSEVPSTCGNGFDDAGEICFEPQRSGSQPPFVCGSDLENAFGGLVDMLVDLDADGDLDVLDHSDIFLNDGTGVFSAPVEVGFPQISNGAAPHAHAGDVDGDGRIDFLRIRDDQLEIVFQRAGGATEQATAPVPPGYLWAVRDFNVDGLDDVLLMSEGHLHVLASNGVSGFAPPQQIPASAIRVQHIADINGDGALDLFVQDSASLLQLGPIFLLTNQGDGSFVASTMSALSAEVDLSLVTIDIDADGALDIAALGRVLLILHNDGAGQFTQVQAIDQSVGGTVRAADFDGDGAPDLAVLEGNGAVYQNIGGTFAQAQYFAGFGRGHTVGDLNADGKADLILFQSPTPVLLGGAN